jgi:hypothetical protein
LWFHDPDPGLPEYCSSGGVSVGDVGTITYDGGFDFMFNIFRAANDAVNQSFGVPDGFVPLQVNTNSKHVLERPYMYRHGTHISSAGIKKVRLSEEECRKMW